MQDETVRKSQAVERQLNQYGQSPAPGWYPTPDGQQRYWDGHRWTEHVAPIAPVS